MKLLNLDSLVSANRSIQIGGDVYEVADQTVGMMLDAIDMTQKGADSTGDEVFRTMVKTAKRILPTCPMEKIESLTITQLSALIEYGVAADEEVAGNSEIEVEEDSEGK